MKEPSTALRAPRWGLGLVLLFGMGCGSRGEVSGTVTYKGKLLSVGTITFLDDNKQVVGSAPITEGKYALSKVPAGPVKIVVTTPRANLKGWTPREKKSLPKSKQLKEEGKPPPTDSEGTKDQSPDAHGKGDGVDSASLPEKYGNPDESGLTYTVKPGSQEHNIELK
jgi:hypothetical protein